MKKQIAITAITASIAVALTGCATHKQNDYSTYKVRSAKEHRVLDGTVDNYNYSNNYSSRGVTPNDGYMRSQNAQNTQNFNALGQEAKSIENKIMKVNGVSKATVFVHDKNVVVGIDTKGTANKAEVEKKVRKEVESLNKGYQVHITSDKNMHSRIADMKMQMAPTDGHPLRDLGADIGTLIKDIGNAITTPVRSVR